MNNQTTLNSPKGNELSDWHVNADGKLVYAPKPVIKKAKSLIWIFFIR